MIFTKQQIKGAYERLSEEATGVISSADTTEIISNIANKVGLNNDESNAFDSEVFWTMLNLQSTSQMSENLMSAFKDREEKIKVAIGELQIKIFSPLAKLRAENPTSIQPSNTIEPQKTETTSKKVDISLISSAENLIEDSKGNADNTLPELPGQKEVTVPVAVAPLTPEVPVAPKQITVQRPEPTPGVAMPTPVMPVAPKESPKAGSPLTDAEWEARKKALEAGELVMKTAYGSKPDPYRELPL